MRGELLVTIVAGVLLALPYALYARRRRRALGYGLVLAAAVYIVFAIRAGDARAAGLEVIGLCAFAVIAVIGIRKSATVLALGWIAHAAWDSLLHPLEHSAYAPWWYPAACIGFDLTVAVITLARRRSR
ncbi:MAG TPA: DUF6010 family protein [Thermoanaerobaculia bacterium]|nr:DUF6010 family protein [Thermoanaerobaculia bacterium]